MQAFWQKKWCLWVDMGGFSIFYHYKVSFFYIFIVSLKTQIATQSETEWKFNFNNLIMED